MYQVIVGGRGSGKTSKLIKIAHDHNLYILCVDQNRVQYILDRARYLDLEINHPITVDELPLRGVFIKEILVDDAEDVLAKMIRKPVHTMTTSMNLRELR